MKWRCVDNLRPTLAYRLAPRPVLAKEPARVLDDLNRRGVAKTSVAALLGPHSCYDDLQQAITALERESHDEIVAAREQSADPALEKSFNFSHIVGRRTLAEDDVFVRFALQRPIVAIANAYFGMYTHLRFVNVWHTFATDAPARDSQLWHRDRDDRLILKLFVYLSDVDDHAGPFTYATGTHAKGPTRGEPPSRAERPGGPKRTADAEMAQVVPPEQWVRATGPAGTIVFADTRGYHCGGLARKSDRLMYHAMFGSSASARRADRVIHCDRRLLPHLDRAQAFALYR